MQSENTPTPSQQPDEPAQPKRRYDKWVKVAFVLAALGIGYAVYHRQRTDPTLDGAMTQLAPALAEAKARGSRVIIVFTHKPMTHEDRDVIGKYFTTSQMKTELAGSKHVLVHLPVTDPAASKYGVKDTPAYALVEPDGTLIKLKEGVMNNPTFINEFLR
jgi:hypothetical protein